PGAHGGDVPPPPNNSGHAPGLSLRRSTNSFPEAQTYSHTFAPCSHPEKTHAPSYRDPLRTNLPCCLRMLFRKVLPEAWNIVTIWRNAISQAFTQVRLPIDLQLSA